MRASSWIWLMGTIFGVLETNHFGWKVMPRSDAEMICDGITILIWALAILAVAVETKKQ
jgi:hypothetical protein